MYKDKRNWVILSLCVIAVIMVTGLSTFSQYLAHDSVLESNNNLWNVGFTDAKIIEENGGKIKSLSYTPSSAVFESQFFQPGNKAVIELTIKNSGSVDARVNNIYTLPYTVNSTYTATSAIVKTVDGIYQNEVLKAGESKKITVTVEYDKNFTGKADGTYENSEIIIDYIQA